MLPDEPIAAKCRAVVRISPGMLSGLPPKQPYQRPPFAERDIMEYPLGITRITPA